MSDFNRNILFGALAVMVVAGIAFYMYSGDTSTTTTTAPTTPPASTGTGTSN